MAIIDFPSSPTDGQTATLNGILYTYNSSKTQWKVTPTEVLSIGDTAPANTTAVPLWWDSSAGRLFIYYNDGTSSQWVDTSPGIPGSQGIQGIQGIQGATGSTGATGASATIKAHIILGLLSN